MNDNYKKENSRQGSLCEAALAGIIVYLIVTFLP